MFDSNFTFSSSRSSATPSTPGYSPCTSPAPFTPPSSRRHFSISDLADQFADQRIERSAQICYDSCQSYSNSIDDDDEMNWLIPPIEPCTNASLERAQTFPSIIQRPHSPSSRRAQRQTNARLLCTAAHREEIAALMARMIDSEEQCLVATAASPPATAQEDEEDEGYNSGEDDSLVETVSRSSSVVVVAPTARRRASDLAAGGACVSKSIRVRKANRHHRRVRTEGMGE